MRPREDIQSAIDRLEGGSVEATEVEPGLWRVRSQSGAEVVVNYAPPVVLLRLRVMEPPDRDDKRSGLVRQPPGFTGGEAGLGSRPAARTSAAGCSASCWSSTPATWSTAPTGWRATTSS